MLLLAQQIVFDIVPLNICAVFNLDIRNNSFKDKKLKLLEL